VVRFEEEDIKGAKYILVEVALKRDQSDKTVGLFRGCQPMVNEHTQLVAANEEFIWLSKDEDTLYMLNTILYDVISVELQRSNFAISYFQATQQPEAIRRLKMAQEIFTKDKKVLKNGLIDLKEYVLTSKVKEALNKTTEAKKVEAKGSVFNRSGAYSHNGTNYHTSNTYSYKKKEPSTFYFKRTTRYPISTAIDKMKGKVEAVRKNKYKAPKLPKILEEETTPTGTKSSVDTEYDDEQFQCGMFC